MAGTAVVLGGAPALHRSRGVVRLQADVTADASLGTLVAKTIGEAWGRLVGVAVGASNAGALVTLTDNRTGATLYTQRMGTAFGNTTTGDTTGGTSEDLFTTGAAHGLSELDEIVFTSITGGGGATGIVINKPYYVCQTTGFAATTFCLATSVVNATLATQVVANVGDADISAATWYATTATTATYKRPSTNIVDNAGATVAADATAPNVNRDIKIAGKVNLALTNAFDDTVVALIVDEAGLGVRAVNS